MWLTTRSFYWWGGRHDCVVQLLRPSRLCILAEQPVLWDCNFFAELNLFCHGNEKSYHGGLGHDSSRRDWTCRIRALFYDLSHPFWNLWQRLVAENHRINFRNSVGQRLPTSCFLRILMACAIFSFVNVPVSSLVRHSIARVNKLTFDHFVFL